MKLALNPVTWRRGAWLIAVLLILAVGVWWWQRSTPVTRSVAPRAIPPTLLPPRAPDAGPAQAWERLLAADGSGREDAFSLRELVDTLLQAVPVNQRPPLGFDTDLARGLVDVTMLGEAALPPTHPALRDGRLIDRWGNPWLVHPLSHDVIQLRSAGPDGRLFTADDLVSPAEVPPEPKESET